MKSVMWKKKWKEKTKESEKMEISTNKWKNSKMVRKRTKEIDGKNETERMKRWGGNKMENKCKWKEVYEENKMWKQKWYSVEVKDKMKERRKKLKE